MAAQCKQSRQPPLHPTIKYSIKWSLGTTKTQLHRLLAIPVPYRHQVTHLPHIPLTLHTPDNPSTLRTLCPWPCRYPPILRARPRECSREISLAA
jgi:hypothetical protein